MLYAECMRRVPLQANVDSKLADAVYRLGERDGVSVSAIVRESVERYVAEREAELDPIDGLVGLWRDEGPAFDAAALDEELTREHEERFG
jgi:hypothetical protein